jgi:hypothetical protein
MLVTGKPPSEEGILIEPDVAGEMAFADPPSVALPSETV